MADVTPLHGPSPVLRRVADEVLSRLDEVVPRMGEAYRREVAEYAAMDAESFARVLRTSEAFVRRFLQSLADGVDRPLPDHPTLVAAGRRRHQAGISLDAAMHAFRLASREGWTAIADATTATAPGIVSDLAARWLEYSDRASTAFAEGHTSATSEELRRLDARRQALVADLVAAPDAAAARAVAQAHGLRLAAAYVPLLLDDSGAGEERVEALVPMGTIVGRRGGHLLALLPADEPLDAVANALAGLGRLAVGEPAEPGAPLAVEVASTESVLLVGALLGRSDPLGPDDLAVHRALREHAGIARALRRQVLEPLVEADPDGIFRETLRAYLDDGAVRAVADRLFVHANTVTYRLRRVRECTGLDPRVPSHAARLVLALALEDLDQGGDA